MIISFAWTTPALISGHKTMTRRDWTAAHAAKFHTGDLVDAWDRSPRTGKGRKVATIRALHVYQHMSDAIHPLDYDDEGFRWLSEHGDRDTVERVIADWRDHARMMWCVQFELVSVEAAP